MAAINTPQDFATAVLTGLGAPVSQSNIQTIVDWIAAENSWPPPRNNPLNNGYGSGGGSGLGSYPDLQTAAADVVTNLESGNYGYPAVVQALISNAPEATFKQAIVNSGWAGGHYQGTDYGAGFTYTPGGGSGGLTAAEYSALGPLAGNQQATAYLEAVAGQGGSAGTSTATPPASVAPTTSGSTEIGGVTYSGTQQQASALSTIEANLQTYGFTPAQVTQLTNWAWGEITNNVDPTQIAIDLQNQPAFQQQYPGFAPANAELNAKGLPAVSVQQYQQYQTQAMAMASAAGLPAGFINSNNIGTLIGGNVSTQELSSRINNALTLAYNSTPEQQAQFNAYFGTQYGNNPYVTGGAPMTAADWQALSQAAAQPGGAAYLQSQQATAPSGAGPLTPGQIAAIALDPNVAEPLIAQEITAAQIGGASVTSGVGSLNVNTATTLAKAGITEAQATNAFQSLAPYSALETPRPGMGNVPQGTVSSDQLATGALLGNPQAQRQLQQAQEVAKAPYAGGGGYVSTTKGAGVGSANPTGAPGA
jgi:hypothetical protein